jgi:predicted nucleic acid-binding protein
VRNPMLLDACIAINLLATDCAEDIAAALGIRFLMAKQAATECGELHVLQEKIVVRRRAAASDIPPLAEVLTLIGSEIDLYVELARDIDDGEAATIAIARSRSLAMATDDRKARRVAVAAGLVMPTGTTAILRQYADTTGMTSRKIAVLLRLIRDESSYVPRQTDENFGWWQQNISL